MLQSICGVVIASIIASTQFVDAQDFIPSSVQNGHLGVAGFPSLGSHELGHNGVAFNTQAIAPNFVTSDTSGSNVLAPPGLLGATFTAVPGTSVNFTGVDGSNISFDLSSIVPSQNWNANTAINVAAVPVPGTSSPNSPRVEDIRKTPHISVSATANVKIPVSRGKATLRVRLESSTLPGASATPIRGPLGKENENDPRYCSSCVQAEVSKRMNNLLSMVKGTEAALNASPAFATQANTIGKKPVYSLRTESVTLTPEYSYENNTRYLSGYTAMNAITVEADSGVIARLIDGAVRAGATEIDNVQMTPSDEDIQTAKLQLEQKAVKNALARARSLLTAAGLTRSAPVLSIEISSSEAGRRYSPITMNSAMMRSSAMDMAGGSAESSTPITAEDSEVSATATVSVALNAEGGVSLVV